MAGRRFTQASAAGNLAAGLADMEAEGAAEFSASRVGAGMWACVSREDAACRGEFNVELHRFAPTSPEEQEKTPLAVVVRLHWFDLVALELDWVPPSMPPGESRYRSEADKASANLMNIAVGWDIVR